MTVEVRNKRHLTGTVESDKMTKTIIVRVTNRQKHGFYQKYLTQRKKYFVHDEKEAASIGDTVEIKECRPMSAMKRWTLNRVVSKASQVAEVDI